MDIASVLAKHDLSLATVMSAEGLVNLRSAYSTLLDTLTADSETQQNREKAIKDGMLKEFPVADTDGGIARDIRSLINEIVSEEPDYLPALCEMLQDIKSDLMVMRDYHVASVARDTKPEKVKDTAEIEVRKDEATALRKAIESVWNLLGNPVDIEGFPTKKSEKTNEIRPDLPRVPIGASTNGSVRGRGAKVRQMRFEFNGKTLPADILFYDIVKNYVCDFANGFVVKATEVIDLVNEDHETFAPEGYDNRWTVEINGNTLSGWLPESK